MSGDTMLVSILVISFRRGMNTLSSLFLKQIVPAHTTYARELHNIMPN